MYVGPWQELQLSKLQRVKAQPAVAAAPSNSDTLRSIESTIVNSLDYVQARLLLDKLGPLLAASGTTGGAAGSLPTLPIQAAVDSARTNGNGTFYDPFNDPRQQGGIRRQRNLRLTQQSLLAHNQSTNGPNDKKTLAQSQRFPSSGVSKFPPVFRISPEDCGIARGSQRGGSSGGLATTTTPLSVRSSMSEPGHGRGQRGKASNGSAHGTGGSRVGGKSKKGGGRGKQLPLLTSQLQSQNDHLEQQMRMQQMLQQSQQQYNAQNAMQLLRLERSTRKVQQLPRPDLSQFWDWKADERGAFTDSEAASTAETAGSGGKRQQARGKEERVKAEKIAMVRRMQQLYVPAGEEGGIQPRPPPWEGIQKSPVRPRLQQGGARGGDTTVADMDLTETDLVAIAKYFGDVSGGAAAPTRPAFADSAAGAGGDSSRRLALLPPAFTDDFPDDPSPLPSPSHHDELYAAGGDGLLNWSTNLVMDDP